jgi:hypothetical protein
MVNAVRVGYIDLAHAALTSSFVSDGRSVAFAAHTPHTLRP